MTDLGDLGDLDAVATAEAVRTGAVTAVDVTTAALERIEARDGEINAFTVVTPESALEHAAAIDARRAAGEPLGALAGVPVGIKDHLWLAGLPATNGSLALRDFVPTTTCVAVQRWLDADAVVVGKTNNPEFCYRGYTDNAVSGLTRNPRDLSRTPGGSSGGSGAAVAAGMVPLAMGTDGGGSIRIPAAFCGVVGFKPTFGLLPKLPGFRGWPTLSVDGPLARTVRDLTLSTSLAAGPAADDPFTWPGPAPKAALVVPDNALAGLRVAVSADLGTAPLDDDVRAAFEAVVARLPAAGAIVTRAHPVTGNPLPLWDTTALAEGFASEGPLLERFADVMTPGTADLVRGGASISAVDYLDVQQQRLAYTATWTSFFDDHDVLLTPTMPTTAFEVGLEGPATIGGTVQEASFDDWCALAVPANLTGFPAASVPMGSGADGLPVALQITAPRWSDTLVLRVAAALVDLLERQNTNACR